MIKIHLNFVFRAFLSVQIVQRDQQTRQPQNMVSMHMCNEYFWYICRFHNARLDILQGTLATIKQPHWFVHIQANTARRPCFCRHICRSTKKHHIEATSRLRIEWVVLPRNKTLELQIAIIFPVLLIGRKEQFGFLCIEKVFDSSFLYFHHLVIPLADCNLNRNDNQSPPRVFSLFCFIFIRKSWILIV